MTEKRYAMKVSIVLGVSVLLMLFFFVLVAHHQDIPDRIRKHRSVPQVTGSSVAERIETVGQVSAVSPDIQREPVKVVVTTTPSSRDGLQVYQATCVVCHGTGIAGAPKLGDKAQWVKRIAKGTDPLYASAVNGIQGSEGAMPPKGGNLALTNAEVKAAVDYMVAQSK